MSSTYVTLDAGVRVLGDALYPDLLEHSSDMRSLAATKWQVAGASWTLGDNEEEQNWTDAIGVGASPRGVHTLIRDEAREKLIPHIGEEATFLPVSVRGAPFGYSFLYITRLLNCLDEKRTRLGRENPYGPTPISVPRFRSESVTGGVFRLPGGRGYQFDYDFCTQRFVESVVALNLTGFRIRENLGSVFVELNGQAPRGKG